MHDHKGQQHITVGALAAEIVRELREKQVNEWDKKSNDGTVRRALYMAWEQVEVIERIKEMVANGQISPRNPLTNFPPGPLSSVESDWYLSEDDAEAVRKWLRHLAEPYPTEEETRRAIEEATITSTFHETVCNGHSINWRYWVHQMPKLTAAQAARLMCGLDPDVFENLANRPNRNDPSDVTEKAKKIQRLAEAHEMHSASPTKWLEWANLQKLSVHFEFRLEVQEILKIERGRYTLEEAAQLIAQKAGEREAVMIQKLVFAVKMKQLPTFEPGRTAVIEYGNGPGKTSVIRDFYEECYWDDLNKWLSANEPRISFRFPAPHSQSEQQAGDSPKQELENKGNQQVSNPERGELVSIVEVANRLSQKLSMGINVMVQKYLIDSHAWEDLEGYFLSLEDDAPVLVHPRHGYETVMPGVLQRFTGDDWRENTGKDNTDRYCWRREQIEKFLSQKFSISISFEAGAGQKNVHGSWIHEVNAKVAEQLPSKLPPVRKQPNGGDTLTPVIWDICYDLREKNSKISPVPVMAQLKIRVDSNDAKLRGPLVSSTAGGVKYECLKGDERELDSEQLRGRIREWKKANPEG